MKDQIKVLVLTQHAVSDALLDNLRQVSPRLSVTYCNATALADLEKVMRDVEVLYTSGVLPTPAQAPRLCWIQGHFAGVNSILGAGEILRQAQLTSASGIHGPVMGEYVLMMMLAHAHDLPRMISGQRERAWPGDFTQRVLRGASVGIVGYGSIGREVARLASTFGMRILACKRDPEAREDQGYALPGTGDPRGELPERIYGFDGLPEMLGQSDYVVLTAPLTPATQNMINAETLRAMKPGAFVVNVGRGGLIDESALAAALRAQQIGGAALDVFVREPLPPDSELWHLPNLIISPHVSGSVDNYMDLAMALFAENLRRYVAGEPLLNIVDVDAGY
jgi:phosphoglycerate dehydrogenase-like enzyme